MHAFDAADHTYDTYYSDYKGNGIYEFRIPEVFDKMIAYRMNPASDKIEYTQWNDSGELAVKNNALYTTAWEHENFKESTYTATTTSYGLIGSFNGWSADVALTEVEHGHWTVTTELADNTEFKIRENGKWDADWGTNEGGNIKVTEAGTYVISLVFKAHKPVVEYELQA